MPDAPRISPNCGHDHHDRCHGWAGTGPCRCPCHTSAACESCGAPATVRLPDGSWWCESCDEGAERLGYNELEVADA